VTTIAELLVDGNALLRYPTPLRPSRFVDMGMI
jgi:hypothetical protein